MSYGKKPAGPAFNPNRLIIDLSTLDTARLGDAAKKHSKSPSVLAALVITDWIKTNTAEPTLDGKPAPDFGPSRTDELAAKFGSPVAPMVSNIPDTSEAIRRLENRPSRPRPFGMV